MSDPQEFIAKELAKHPIMYLIPGLSASGVNVLSNQLAETIMGVVEVRLRKTHRRLSTMRRREAILSLRNMGLKNTEIAERLMLSESSIYKAMAR